MVFDPLWFYFLVYFLVEVVDLFLDQSCPNNILFDFFQLSLFSFQTALDFFKLGRFFCDAEGASGCVENLAEVEIFIHFLIEIALYYLEASISISVFVDKSTELCHHSLDNELVELVLSLPACFSYIEADVLHQTQISLVDINDGLSD